MTKVNVRDFLDSKSFLASIRILNLFEVKWFTEDARPMSTFVTAPSAVNAYKYVESFKDVHSIDRVLCHDHHLLEQLP